MLFASFASLAVLVAFLLGGAVGAQETPRSDLEPEALLELESLLQRLGFAPGSVDGTIDEVTLEAIGRYQEFSFREGPAEISRALLLELRGVAEALDLAEPLPEPAEETVQELAVVSGSAPEIAVATEETETIEPVNQPGLKALAELETLVESEPQATTEPALETAAAPEAVLDPVAEAPVEIPVEIPVETPVETPVVAPAQDDEDDGLSPRTREILEGYQDDLASGRRDPRPLARALNLAGRTAFEDADYEEAIALYSAAITLDPEFAGAYHNRGAAQQAVGRTAEAATDFEAAFTRGWGRLKLSE